VGHLDVALVSHDQHPDNLDRSGRALLAEIPLVLTTPQSAERLGGTAHGLAPFDEVTVERASGRPLRITALPALHGPPGADTVSGPVTGFLLAGDDVPSVYVSGDNASLDVVREIVEFVGAVDVAVLFAGAASVPQLLDGATLTLTSVDAAEAARLLRARVVIPVHCEGWSHYQESSSTLRTAFRSAGLAQVLTVVDAGQTVTL
jgi:L-ascorbate metabolism protein UlaG (beta-lactamase superfamily)